MEGCEISHAILWEVSSGGPPYEMEVCYNDNNNVSFSGGWTKFVVDHDLHHDWFLMFNYRHGTSKFDVQIFDGTQCQQKYDPALK
jgi:hypothetical protein